MVSLRGQRVIIVLGMHRSGTSSLAGSLEEAGLFLGGDRLASEARFNAKGNREPKRLNRLHEGLLNANGGTWFAPPATVAWTDRDRERRDDFIRSRASERIWGFKDPRTLLVMDGWLEALPKMEMVASIRDPMAVAMSLLRRAETTDKRSRELSLEDWLALWRTYNERLLELYAGHEARIEAGPYQRYRDVLAESLRALCADLDVEPDADQVSAFSSSVGAWPAFPDTARALRRLATRFRLGVITNCDDDLFAA